MLVLLSAPDKFGFKPDELLIRYEKLQKALEDSNASERDIVKYSRDLMDVIKDFDYSVRCGVQ